METKRAHTLDPVVDRTFNKAEKLCGKSDIARLMDHGRRGAAGCLRYCCLVTPVPPTAVTPVASDTPVSPDPLISPAAEPLSDQVRILVSVPKKIFKRAVKRNLLKRRIREAFRLQKALLLAPDTSGTTPETNPVGAAPRRFDILFTYNAPDVRPYDEIRAAVAAILSEIRSFGH